MNGFGVLIRRGLIHFVAAVRAILVIPGAGLAAGREFGRSFAPGDQLATAVLAGPRFLEDEFPAIRATYMRLGLGRAGIDAAGGGGGDQADQGREYQRQQEKPRPAAAFLFSDPAGKKRQRQSSDNPCHISRSAVRQSLRLAADKVCHGTSLSLSLSLSSNKRASCILHGKCIASRSIRRSSLKTTSSVWTRR